MNLGLAEQRSVNSKRLFFGYLSLLPYYLPVLAILALMALMIPSNYGEIQPNRIVPENISADKVIDYIKQIPAAERSALISRERIHFFNEPLDRNSLLNLGILYGLDGNTQKGNDVLLRVANRSSRDIGAQTTAINISLARKDYADALNRMDGLIRSHSQLSFLLRCMALMIR